MTKSLNFLTGILSPRKSSAKRSIPRPLLVVHSGKTTMGRSALWRISPRLLGFSAVRPYGGTCPVRCKIANSDTWRKPRIGFRSLKALLDVDILAEPVPVRRPGVVAVGVCEASRGTSMASNMGRTNIGLNLKSTMR
jgi:hypothetical protein